MPTRCGGARFRTRRQDQLRSGAAADADRQRQCAAAAHGAADLSAGRHPVVQARAARLADTAALFQALGGGWWNRVEPPSGEAPRRTAPEKQMTLVCSAGRLDSERNRQAGECDAYTSAETARALRIHAPSDTRQEFKWIFCKETNFAFLGRKTSRKGSRYLRAKRQARPDHHRPAFLVRPHHRAHSLEGAGAQSGERVVVRKDQRHRAQSRAGDSRPECHDRQKCAMLPVEAVVRGYLTGVTDTAAWTQIFGGSAQFRRHRAARRHAQEPKTAAADFRSDDKGSRSTTGRSRPNK